MSHKVRLRMILAYEFSGQRSYASCDIPTRARIDALIEKIIQHDALRAHATDTENRLKATSKQRDELRTTLNKLERAARAMHAGQYIDNYGVILDEARTAIAKVHP